MRQREETEGGLRLDLERASWVRMEKQGSDCLPCELPERVAERSVILHLPAHACR